jgi:hypothetical protein
MGSLVPTSAQQLTETEAQLSKFRHTLRASDRYVFDGLFAMARRHIAAMSQSEALLPFESALLAIVLEQAKQIAVLQQKVEVLESRPLHGNQDRLAP